MDINTQVTINGKASRSAYETGSAVRHELRTELPELAGLCLDELEPKHIDQLRERLAAALKDAGKRLSADLDLLEEQALTRAANHRKAVRDLEEAA